MKPMLPLSFALILAACSGPQAPVAEAPPAAGSASPAAPAEPPAAPAEPPAAQAEAPAAGRVIRANCRMGGCWWYRFESVQREDATPPRYRLQVRVGDSGPHPDPYPLDAAGVDIRWDEQAMAATVACSRESPRVTTPGGERTLALDPEGVTGVDQDVANLYFATCHGESGDDGALARKFGYARR